MKTQNWPEKALDFIEAIFNARTSLAKMALDYAESGNELALTEEDALKKYLQDLEDALLRRRFGHIVMSLEDKKAWLEERYAEIVEGAHFKKYQATICSACPFCKGFAHFVKYNFAYTCKTPDGLGSLLVQTPLTPLECFRLEFDNQTLEELKEEILQSFGKEALDDFNAKWTDLSRA